MVPIVAFDQIYTFSKDALIEAIPRPEGIPAARFGPAARELFETIMQMTDNAGATDENRALNYLSVRYPANLRPGGRSLCRQSRADRRGCPALVADRHTQRRRGDLLVHPPHHWSYPEKSFVRVDVTDEFPYLVTKMSPYYDR